MNWLMNFTPHMVLYVNYGTGPYDDVYIAEAVCANRVFRVRRAIAIKNAKGDEKLIKLLGG